LRIKIVYLFKLNPHWDVVMGTQEEFIEDINDRAFLAYKPVPYPGKMTICKLRRNYAFLRDPFNGWGGIAAGGLEVIELPSDPGASSSNRTCKPWRRTSRSKSIRPLPSAPKFLIRRKRF
jgi:hypothetical protein